MTTSLELDEVVPVASAGCGVSSFEVEEGGGDVKEGVSRKLEDVPLSCGGNDFQILGTHWVNFDKGVSGYVLLQQFEPAVGVSLWGEVESGKVVRHHGFDADGHPVQVFVFEPRTLPGVPQVDDRLGFPPRGPLPYSDGGTSCAIVCAAAGDGGGPCWKECK